MDSWFPCSVGAFDLLVDALDRSGEVWPDEVCLMDLRRAYDRDGKVPGRRALAKRWRVTDRVARRILADVAGWWDLKRGVPPVSRERPACVPPVSRERPADARADADLDEETSRERPASVPRASRERPADVHTRVGVHTPQPQPQPQPQDTLTSPLAPVPVVEPAEPLPRARRLDRAAFDRLAARWKQHKPGGPDLDPTRGLGKALAARLKDHGEDAVGQVLSWYATSPHQRADYLRREGHGLDTLMRPSKFEEYLGFAQGPVTVSRIEGMGHHPGEDTYRPSTREERLASIRRLKERNSPLLQLLTPEDLEAADGN